MAAQHLYFCTGCESVHVENINQQTIKCGECEAQAQYLGWIGDNNED